MFPKLWRSDRLPHERPVLGLDTSAKHCSVAVACGGKILSSKHAATGRGQAEALFPMILETMRDAGVELNELSAVGTGTGPGSFTGVRVGVSAARGLALSLGMPAVGVNAFDLSAFGIPGRVLSIVDAGRGFAYARACPDGDAIHFAIDELPGRVRERLPVVGFRSGDVAASIGTEPLPPRHLEGEAAALIAAERLPHAGPRPEPLYLRPAVLPAGKPIRAGGSGI